MGDYRPTYRVVPSFPPPACFRAFCLLMIDIHQHKMRLQPTDSDTHTYTHTHTHTNTHAHTHTRKRMRMHTVLNTDEIFEGLKSKFGAAVWPRHSHATHLVYSVLQCVAMCCGVLQLQCAAVWPRHTHTTHLFYSVLQCAAMCCGVLQCVAVAVCCCVAQTHTHSSSLTPPPSHALSLPFTHTLAHMQATFLEDSNPCEVLPRNTQIHIYIFRKRVFVRDHFSPTLTHTPCHTHTHMNARAGDISRRLACVWGTAAWHTHTHTHTHTHLLCLAPSLTHVLSHTQTHMCAQTHFWKT